LLLNSVGVIISHNHLAWFMNSSYLRYLCLFANSCAVFLLCFSSSCYHFLWIVHFWLPFRYSLIEVINTSLLV
jgi:hypothetical protein